MHFYYETKHLILKVLDQSAAASVLTFYAHGKSAFEPYEPSKPDSFYTLSYQRRNLAAEYRLILENKGVRFFLFVKEHPNTVIGTLSFLQMKRGAYLSCDLGYKFLPEYQHLGYAQESILKGIQIMFQEEKMHRIEAFVMPSNTPSLHLLERLGFQYEGIAFQSIRIAGQWEDHMCYSLICSDSMRT